MVSNSEEQNQNVHQKNSWKKHFEIIDIRPEIHISTNTIIILLQNKRIPLNDKKKRAIQGANQ